MIKSNYENKITPHSTLRAPNSILAIVGPTCTFKSSIAIRLAEKYPFEIISADSRLVYKGMDIGTSKPTLEERKSVPHHMIDLIEPNEEYTVAEYKRECEKKIQEIISRGKKPLLVGGTGLYLNSILLGLSIPEVKPDQSFRRQLREMSQDELHGKLKKLDPKAAEKIHKNDNVRTVRALEVIYKTNKLFSELKQSREIPYNVIWAGLTYEDRELHTQKIKERTKNFLNNGFIDEVKNLLTKYGEIDLFKNTIGYKECIEYLNGKISETHMIERITLATRQLAKRQMTWFKANKKINWIYLDKTTDEEAYLAIEDLTLLEERSFANTSIVSAS